MASLWYKAHVDLPDHPKTSAAAYILGIDADLLVGKLYRLWSWALCNREDGFFAKHEIPLIAEKMRWKKSEKKLMEALLNVPKGENAGFITEAEGGYQLYNWHKYAGKLIISTHTLRVEGDGCNGRSFAPFSRFQPTPSAWRVTPTK